MEKITNRPLLLLLFYLFFFSIYPSTGQTQPVYDLLWEKELPLLTGGVVGTAASFLLRVHHQPLTDAEIAQLNSNDLNVLDRSATRYYGRGAKNTSNVLLTLSYALPITTLFLQDVSSYVGTIGVMLAETLLLNEAFTGIAKTLVARPRPYTYNLEVPEIAKKDHDSNLSFFSAHASYAAALSFFTAKVITDYTDNRTVEIMAWTGAVLWPAITGYTRYRAGMHFPTDIITGFVVGASLGYIIPQLHKVKSEKKTTKPHFSQLNISPTGLYVVFVF